MSQQHFYWFLLQLPFDLATQSLSVVDVFCRDPVLYVVTRLFVFSSTLCRDPVCYVTTRPLFLVLESLSRHRKVSCDLVC